MNILTAFYKNTEEKLRKDIYTLQTNLPIEKLLSSTYICQVIIIGFNNDST